MPGFPTGLGEYEVRGVLGSGASGTVYLAYQASLERLVALKELSSELTANPEFRERFRAEAEMMATGRPQLRPGLRVLPAIGPRLPRGPAGGRRLAPIGHR